MIELTVLNHLKKTLDVSVGFQTLKDEDEFIVIGKTGSTNQEHTHSATFFIQSYSTTKLNACKLNEKVKEAMKKLIESNDITYVRLNTDYDYTDTTLKKERYQAIYDIGFF